GGPSLPPAHPPGGDVSVFPGGGGPARARHDATYYPRFKKWCDEYFYLPHRGETRGVGGIFFDYLRRDDIEETFAFVRDAGDTFLPAYLPIVERRRGEPWGEPDPRFHPSRPARH